MQKRNWYRKSGHDVALFIPHTPQWEFIRRMRVKEAKNNQGRNTWFLIVGKEGITLEQRMRRSNPWCGANSRRPGSFPCKVERGGDCWSEGVTYTLWCDECGEGLADYQGKTGRNGYTRGLEHLANLDAKNEDKSLYHS